MSKVNHVCSNCSEIIPADHRSANAVRAKVELTKGRGTVVVWICSKCRGVDIFTVLKKVLSPMIKAESKEAA